MTKTDTHTHKHRQPVDWLLWPHGGEIRSEVSIQRSIKIYLLRIVKINWQFNLQYISFIAFVHQQTELVIWRNAMPELMKQTKNNQTTVYVGYDRIIVKYTFRRFSYRIDCGCDS